MTAADLRPHALDILKSCLEAVDPYQAVRRALVLEGDQLRVGGQVHDLGAYRRIIAVGAGKAGAPMAQALEDALGPRLEGGRVVVKRGHGAPTKVIELLEASHPLPDQGSVEAGQAVMETLASSGEDTLVFCLLSGGGSALLVAPSPGLTLADKQETTRLLLASGADIGEINAVRKHLSAIKGGGLALLAAPATLITLALSDVVGDRPDVIASGPTVGDTSTWTDVRGVLRRYGLLHKVPPVVRQRLEMGVAGRVADTPKPGQDYLARGQYLVVASNRQALLAGQERASGLGYATMLLTSSLTGEARHVGQVLAALAREAAASGHPLAPPCCLLAGGETTVTLGDSHGQGGRNQELALAAALGLAGQEGVLLLSAGSDGTDGPTDAAGAFASGRTVAEAQAQGFKPRLSLERHDAYPLFQALGDLLISGPTRTNVMDLQILLVAA